MEFNVWIKKCRIVSGLTQGQAADKMGYETGQFISNWERGKSHPPLDSLRGLSKAYGVPLDLLFRRYMNDVRTRAKRIVFHRS